MSERHIITAEYSATGHYRTRPVFQYDYGQELQLEGFEDLPEVFEMHFGTMVNGKKAVAQVGTGGVIRIPDECLMQRQPVFGWLVMHDAETDGETTFIIEIPVISRAAVEDRVPNEVQSDAITDALIVMNEVIERMKRGMYIPVAEVQPIIDDYEGRGI